MIATVGYWLLFLHESQIHRVVFSVGLSPELLIAQWFGSSGTPLGFFDRLPVFAVAAWIIIAGFGVGWVIIEGCHFARGVNRLERSIFALASGLNLLSLLTLLVGLMGGLHLRSLFVVAMIVLGAGGAWAVWKEWGASLSSRAREASSKTPFSHLALRIVIGLLCVTTLLGAALPPWDFDVLEYHLQVPKEWFRQGQITFLPHNVYGNMPLGGEMHALLAMTLMPGERGWFYGALAGKVVMASFSLLTAAGLYAAGARFYRPWCGLIAAVLYLSHPWIAHVSVNGLNDGILACYVFLAAYALWLSRTALANVGLAGFLAGAAAACKYPGAAFAVLPLLAWTLWPAPSSERAGRLALRWKAALAFLIAATLGGGAWYAKNAVLTGNPTYPMLYGVFDGKTRTPEKDAQWRKAHQVPHDQQGNAYSIGQLMNSAKTITLSDKLASPLLLPLLAVALISGFFTLRQGSTSARFPALPFVILLVITVAIWWLASHRLDRFLLPAWPFAALLAARGTTWSKLPAWRWTSGTILGLGLLYCFLAVASPLVGDNRWFVSLEQLRRDGPWSEPMPQRVSPAHRWLNANVKPGQAVLLVGDAAPFDLEPVTYYNTCFDSCLLCDWMIDRTVQERKRELEQRNIAWVYVDWNEIRRYQSPGNYGFDPRFDEELLDELVEQGILGPPSADAGQSTEAKPRPPELYPVLPPPNQTPSR